MCLMIYAFNDLYALEYQVYKHHQHQTKYQQYINNYVAHLASIAQNPNYLKS